jgi:hypothetical protein
MVDNSRCIRCPHDEKTHGLYKKTIDGRIFQNACNECNCKQFTPEVVVE